MSFGSALLLLTLCALPLQAQETPMSFFITSAGPGNGADLGGLAGADAHCQALAAAVDAGDRTWRAYLSAAPTEETRIVHARDRIGVGPWHNALGVRVAADLAELHGDNNLIKETSITEAGTVVNGRGTVRIVTTSSPGRKRMARQLTMAPSPVATGRAVTLAAPSSATTIAPEAALTRHRGTRRTRRGVAVRAICGAPAVMACSTALPCRVPGPSCCRRAGESRRAGCGRTTNSDGPTPPILFSPRRGSGP